MIGIIGDHLKAYTFEYLLAYGLADMPDTVDKRQGSPIYDAAAMTAKMLTQGFVEMRQVYTDTFARYSGGEALHLRTEENGVNPQAASNALRKGVFVGMDDLPYAVPIGSRFATIDGDSSINFVVADVVTPGTYQLQCEIAGSVGNDYIGALLPIDVLNNLKAATMTDIIVPGDDPEEDDPLRVRFFEEKNSKKFGGNIDQYREWITSQDGVGACQIYPVWAGGGTVKISFVDSTYAPASTEHVTMIQRLIDPTRDGQGIGIAPIDHIVTVVTPSLQVVDVSATVQVANGYTLEQLQPLISAEIEKYFVDARIDWGEPASADNNDYSLTVFRSQVSAAIVRVPGVLNVLGLRLNGLDQDVELQEDAVQQELPRLGVVTFA